jgi:hypothetical protein
LESEEIICDQMKRREVCRHQPNPAERRSHVGEALYELGIKYN